jgi:hypothetical protein
MKKLVLLLACCAPTQAHAALIFYDGFEYTAGQALAPTNDTTGTPNPGQHNTAYNVDWRYAGGGTAGTNDAPTVGSTGLVAPGYPTSPGNSVQFNTSQIGSTRIQISPTAISSGVVYWSGVLRVNSINTLTSGVNGMMLGGYNNTPGPGGLPTAVGAVLRIRKDATLNQYYIGTAMNSGTGVGNVQFDTTPHFDGETVFIVAAYEFISGATNDKAYMWINPDASTYGAASPPTPLLTSAPALADAFPSLSTFNLRNVNTVGSADIQFDELRVGNEWESVTVPEPSAVGILFAGLLLGRFRPRKR